MAARMILSDAICENDECAAPLELTFEITSVRQLSQFERQWLGIDKQRRRTRFSCVPSSF
jgi:hypothetical protein